MEIDAHVSDLSNYADRSSLRLHNRSEVGGTGRRVSHAGCRDVLPARKATGIVIEGERRGEKEGKGNEGRTKGAAQSYGLSEFQMSSR